LEDLFKDNYENHVTIEWHYFDAVCIFSFPLPCCQNPKLYSVDVQHLTSIAVDVRVRVNCAIEVLGDVIVSSA